MGKLEILERDVSDKAVEPVGDPLLEELAQNFELLDEVSEDWIDSEEDEEEGVGKKEAVYTLEDIPKIRAEREDLQRFHDLAASIFKNSKGDSLLIALEQGFRMTEDLGAQKKAVIFTESRITQQYLWDLLSEQGYVDKILFLMAPTMTKSRKRYTLRGFRNIKIRTK